MKTLMIAMFAVLVLGIGSAFAAPGNNQPAPSLQTFDAGWANG